MVEVCRVAVVVEKEEEEVVVDKVVLAVEVVDKAALAV